MNAPEVLDHKADLLVRLENPDVRKAFVGQTALDLGEATKRGPVATDEVRGSAAALIQTLWHIVPEATAYHVNADMTSLVAYAASQLDEEDRVDRTIIPTQTGIVRFDGGIPWKDVRGKDMRLCWAVWGPILGRSRQVKVDGTWQDTEPEEMTALWLFNDQFDAPDQIAHEMFEKFGEDWSRRIFGRWGYMGVENMADRQKLGPAWRVPDDTKAEEVLAEGDVPQAYGNPTRLMHAFFLLLGQTVSDVKDAELARPYRKRADRRGIPARVVVVQLRHKDTRRSEGESLVEWSHRWVVRGFWRWQVCGPNHPLAQELEPGKFRARIWIAPFVKGPSDKPLIVTDKVYALHR